MKMKTLTLDKIAQVTGGKYVGPLRLRAERITCVSMDSREIGEG